MERAERIYHAMLSRGFTGTMLFVKTYHLRVADFTLLTALGVALYILRTYDVVGTIGRQTERMF
jgi:energy-coupling factor transporter transmembrane protein EcfT